jgi:hypothetical protein
LRLQSASRKLQWKIMDPIIRVVAKVLVPLFFFGMAGAAVVVVISFIEDLKELFGEEE